MSHREIAADGSPRGARRADMIAGAFALLAAGAIAVNALYLQKGRHPAPIFQSAAASAAKAQPAEPKPPAAVERREAVALPRPRPQDAIAARPEPMPVPRPLRNEPAPAPDVPRPPDPIGEMIAPPAKRVSAVQRVLSDYGYGQLNPTGVVDRDTEEAIGRFERARRLPVTRQITPVLLRELAALAGRPIE